MLRIGFAALAFVTCNSLAQAQGVPGKEVSWKRIVIDKTFRSEGVGIADVNKDGKKDIITGDVWYEAPNWKMHVLSDERKFDIKGWNPLNYSESFAVFPEDFNGDGWVDVIVIPFPGKACYWYQNPAAKGGSWKQHLLTNSACNETPIYVDLFGKGKKNLVMGWQPEGKTNEGELCYFVPGKDPTKPWQRISVSGPSIAKKIEQPGTQRFSHGLGHGDVNKDGRTDVIVPQGWWEQPAKIDGKPWKFHAAKLGPPSADMYALDLDGDGKNDVVSSSAHLYGFWWFQQKAPEEFVQRELFPDPPTVTKLPAETGLSAEEKALYDAITKARNDQKRAPWAVSASLSQQARIMATAAPVAQAPPPAAKPEPKTVVQMQTQRGRFGLRRRVVPVVVQVPEPNPPTCSGSAKPATSIAPKSSYSGRVVASSTEVTTMPDINAMVKKFLAANKLDEKDNVSPALEVGIGAGKDSEGKQRLVILVGDSGKFSLPSQTHALHHIDINGDGLKDLVTGRRWWAHGPKGDAGPNDPAYIYWFEARKNKDGSTQFIPHEVDDDSGIGTAFVVDDLDGDGIPDIVISNKRGVYAFLQVRTRRE